MKLRNTSKIFLSIIFLLLFAVLSKYEDRAFIRNLDFTVTVKVQDYIGKFCTVRCDGLFEDIGFFAGPLFSVFGTTIITIINFIKTKGRRKLLSLGIPFAFVLLTLVEVYGKTIVRHPAPPFFMLKNPTTIFPTYHVWQEFSYPSGHAARAVFLAFSSFSLLFSHFLKRKRRETLVTVVALGAYVLLVSVSRIYLGHHWFTDVIGGIILGGAFASLSWIAL